MGGGGERERESWALKLLKICAFDLKNRLFRLKRQKKSKNLRLEKFIFEVPYSLLFETVKTFKTSPFDRCEERYSQR